MSSRNWSSNWNRNENSGKRNGKNWNKSRNRNENSGNKSSNRRNNHKGRELHVTVTDAALRFTAQVLSPAGTLHKGDCPFAEHPAGER